MFVNYGCFLLNTNQKRDIEPKKTKDATEQQQPDSQQQQQENSDIIIQQQPLTDQQMEVEEEKNILEEICMDGMPLDEAIVHCIEKCSMLFSI